VSQISKGNPYQKNSPKCGWVLVEYYDSGPSQNNYLLLILVVSQPSYTDVNAFRQGTN